MIILQALRLYPECMNPECMFPEQSISQIQQSQTPLIVDDLGYTLWEWLQVVKKLFISDNPGNQRVRIDVGRDCCIRNKAKTSTHIAHSIAKASKSFLKYLPFFQKLVE